MFAEDTVLGVQALSVIAPQFYFAKPFGTISVEAEGQSVTFSVDADNRFNVQTAKLPVSADIVTVTGTGSGLFFVSISAKYHVETGLVEPSFTVSAIVTRDTASLMELEVCARYTKGKASNMANIEIRLPTDFTLEAESREELLKTAKRVETFDGKVLLYLDSITDNEVCVSVTATGNGAVNKPKPCPVKVFDYYSPDESALEFYILKSLQRSYCESALCQQTNGCKTKCANRKRK